jgi:hypothetical protein
MKWLLSVLFFAILIVGNTGSTNGQDPRGVGSGGAPQDKAGPAIKDLSSLVNEIFAPVTDKLNLTKEQQFQIIAIITETEIRIDPLLQSLAAIDQQLSKLTFSELLDENNLKEICDQEAAIWSEVIQMRVRAKVAIYRLLTTEQRTIVFEQFRMKNEREGRLGSISIY